MRKKRENVYFLCSRKHCFQNDEFWMKDNGPSFLRIRAQGEVSPLW